MPTDIIINGRFLTQGITGVQRYARELLTAFDILLEERSDLDVRLLTPPMNAADIPVLRNIRHRMVGQRQGHAWEQIDLPRHVKDAVLFCPGNTAPILSLLGTRRVVVTVHDLSYRYFPEAYSRSFRLLYNGLIPLILRRARRIITVSSSEKQAIVKHYPFSEGRLIAIQNGGLPTGMEQQVSQPSVDPTILYVGSLSKRKNFPGMLAAAVHLARKRGVHFVFIGSVPQGLMDTLLAIPEDLRGYISFEGQVNDWGQLLGAYRSAHGFLFPSFYEASPLPPVEAMGCGCPVIAGDIPSLRERCGNAALYCDPTDADDIVKSIEMLLDDPELHNILQTSGYAQASRYSWLYCAEETLKVLLQAEIEP